MKKLVLALGLCFFNLSLFASNDIDLSVNSKSVLDSKLELLLESTCKSSPSILHCRYKKMPDGTLVKLWCREIQV